MKIGQNWQIWQKNAKIVENRPKPTKIGQNGGFPMGYMGSRGGVPRIPPEIPPIYEVWSKKKKIFALYIGIL